MDDHPDALLPARYGGIGDGCTGVSELAEVRCERGWVLGEDGEDRTDDVAREVWWGLSGAEREEGLDELREGRAGVPRAVIASSPAVELPASPFECGERREPRDQPIG